MMQTIEELCTTYFYVSLGGDQFQVPWIVAVIVAFALLMMLLTLIIVLAVLCRKTGKEKRIKIISEYDDIFYFEKVEEPVELPTLDQIYAESRNLVICPFCETFNSPKNTQCCACGQVIQRRGV